MLDSEGPHGLSQGSTCTSLWHKTCPELTQGLMILSFLLTHQPTPPPRASTVLWLICGWWELGGVQLKAK